MGYDNVFQGCRQWASIQENGGYLSRTPAICQRDKFRCPNPLGSGCPSPARILPIHVLTPRSSKPHQPPNPPPTLTPHDQPLPAQAADTSNFCHKTIPAQRLIDYRLI